jgi:hypothetical protein
MYTTNHASATFSTDEVLGDLRVNERFVDEAATGNRSVGCVAFTQLVAGDTLCALGFRTGGRRIVRATRIIDGVGYVQVKEGWYRWKKVYAHVI